MTNNSNRRYSYPLQSKTHQETNNDRITSAGPSHSKILPLTEENLAIHTQNFPPCKDARRRHALLFVENQRPVIEMELLLEEQREQEIALFTPISPDNKITFSNPFSQEKKKKNWIQRLTHWIRPDLKEQVEEEEKEKKRHQSWSAGIPPAPQQQEEFCQKRDSGISLFQSKRRSSSIFTSIPIVRQPRFSPTLESDEFVAYKYPTMVRKDNDGHATTVLCRNLNTSSNAA